MDWNAKTGEHLHMGMLPCMHKPDTRAIAGNEGENIRDQILMGGKALEVGVIMNLNMKTMSR